MIQGFIRQIFEFWRDIPGPFDHMGLVFWGFLIGAALPVLCAYGFPALLALYRRKKDRARIIAVNLLLGGLLSDGSSHLYGLAQRTVHW